VEERGQIAKGLKRGDVREGVPSPV